MSKYRYPGLNAYTRDDAFIFKGRDNDSSKLLKEIILNKTLVLHAESGVGKSSMIQAGLLPLIEKFNNLINEDKSSDKKFIPIVIQLSDLKTDKSDTVLIDYIKSKIYETHPEVEDEHLTLLSSETDKSLWVINKLLEKGSERLLLIFDQFEYLQNFNKKQVECLKKELFDLLSPKISLRLYASIEATLSAVKNVDNEYTKEYEILSFPSSARLLFVIREDELGTMTLLSDCFPDILKYEITIDPLTQEDAFKAIYEPARAEGNFKSAPFKFKFDLILTKLIQGIADNETALVDPIQLQIVARDIERNIVIKNKKIIIEEGDIPEVEHIINKFYVDCWDTVASTLKLNEQEEFELKKKIVPQLIVNNRRDLLTKGRLDGSAEATLKILKKEGLVREIISDGTFYQLSHDRLVEPCKNEILRIEERKRAEKAVALETEAQRTAIRKKNNRIKLFGIIIFTSLLIVGTLSYYLIRLKELNKTISEQRIISAVQILRQSNPTFAYFLLKEYENSINNNASKNFKDYISFFEKSKYAFQKTIYPFSSKIVNVDQQNDSTIVVVDKYDITTWNTFSKIIIKQQKLVSGYYVAKKKIINKDLYLVRIGDTLQIKSLTGDIEKQFTIEGSIQDNNIDISSDGKYIIIEDSIFNYNTKQFIGKLPTTELNDHDQMSTIFLNDGKHVAAGYWSGAKFIFRIDEKAKDKVRISAIYPPVDGRMNYVITCLAIDSKDRFLYAGTRDSKIEVWKTGSFERIDSLGDSYLKSVVANMDKANPFNTYVDHGDVINSLAVSLDDSLLLSGSDDNTAILWNNASGKKLAIFLNGRTSKVLQVGFLPSNEEMYTATDDELLFLWSRNKASKLYEEKQLARFSPFDYYMVGLAKDKDEFKDQIYDTIKTVPYFANTLHYIISMPVTNLYPDDAEYLKNIRLSLSEVDQMFNSLTKRKDFNSAITIENKRLLYKYYNDLKFRSADLLLKTEDESKKAKYKRIAEAHIQNMRTIFLDTSDVETAISNSADFRAIGNFWQDSLRNNTKAFYYYSLSSNILQAFASKFPDDRDLNTEIITTYGDFALCYLYANMPDSAIIVANQLKKVQNGNGIADMRIIQAYLLQNKYDEAVALYERKKDIIVRPDQEENPKSLKDWLVPRLERLKARKISTAALESFIDYLKNQPTPVKLHV